MTSFELSKTSEARELYESLYGQSYHKRRGRHHVSKNWEVLAGRIHCGLIISQIETSFSKSRLSVFRRVPIFLLVSHDSRLNNPKLQSISHSPLAARRTRNAEIM